MKKIENLSKESAVSIKKKKKGNYRTKKYSNWKSTDLIDSIVEDRINELRASQQNWLKLNNRK